MYPPTHKPTETTYERQDLLRQERRNRRLTRRREARSEEFSSSEPRMAELGQAALSTMLAGVLVIAGVVAAMMVVGPGEAIDWVVTYLFPVGVITGVVITALALLVQTVKRLPTSPLRDWYQ